MNNQTSEVSLMKELAKSAKQRLKNKNYAGQDTRSFRGGIININSIRTVGKPQIIVKLIDDNCQTEFCKKVRAFLTRIESEDTVINPMGELVDKKYMQSLNTIERQRYIFDIAERYNRIKEDFKAEQILVNSY